MSFFNCFSSEQHSADFLQYLQILCNTLQIFCNTCRFSATFCRFSAIPVDFLQYLQIFCNTLQIFCNTCRFSVTLCGFSAIPADFLQYLQIFCNTLQIFCNTLRNFCGASSDDINSCTAQRSSVLLFPWWLMVFSACLQIYPNFTRSQPRAYHVTSMLLLSKAIHSWSRQASLGGLPSIINKNMSGCLKGNTPY